MMLYLTVALLIPFAARWSDCFLGDGDYESYEQSLHVKDINFSLLEPVNEWKTQDQLVGHLSEQYGIGQIKSKNVIVTMVRMDRKNYIDQTPYEDIASPIGYGAHFSSPQVHGVTLEALVDFLKPGSKVLDVGSGNGYMTACLALMVGKAGRVFGVEHVPELVELAKTNIMKNESFLLLFNRVKFIVGDGHFGLPEEAPFDVIHVGAVIEKPTRVPKPLLEQLKPGGRLVVPVIRNFADICFQELLLVDKALNGTITIDDPGILFETWYEYLADREAQLAHKFDPNLMPGMKPNISSVEDEVTTDGSARKKVFKITR